MLWRAGYSTRELGPVDTPAVAGVTLEGVALPPELQGVFTAGFDLKAQAELGIWRRLLTEAHPNLRVSALLFLGEPGPKTLAAARSLFPRSLWADVSIVETSEAWLDVAKPDRPERSIAGIVAQGVIDPLMIGIPTEEAWDRFKQRLASLAND